MTIKMTTAQAQDALAAQADVLARFATQCEALAPQASSDYYRGVLSRRASLARDLAAVYFRAGTADLEPGTMTELPRPNALSHPIAPPVPCTHCLEQVRADTPASAAECCEPPALSAGVEAAARRAPEVGWEACIAAAEALCQVYYEIAAAAIGEEAVIRQRDARLAARRVPGC